MGYYLRVLTPSVRSVSVTRVRAALVKNSLSANLAIASETTEGWTQLALDHADGEMIALIDKDEVRPGSPNYEYIEEFLENIRTSRPESAVNWLSEYLPTVKTIYSFKILAGTYTKNGWDIVRTVQAAFWTSLGGIFQADCEGFSNEDGFHILWQFRDDVKGPWWMGVLQDGEWVHFRMDLENLSQREVFLSGNVPEGVELGNRGS